MPESTAGMANRSREEAHEQKVESVPGAGDILGVPQAAGQSSPCRGNEPLDERPFDPRRRSDPEYDPPAGPGLDPSLHHHQPESAEKACGGAQESSASPDEIARDFIAKCGSVDRAREALQSLATNPAIDLVVQLGGVAHARQALERAAERTA